MPLSPLSFKSLSYLITPVDNFLTLVYFKINVKTNTQPLNLVMKPIYRLGSIMMPFFYICAIVMYKVKDIFFCEAHVSRSKVDLGKVRFYDIRSIVSESNKIDLSISMNLTGNEYNRWPINCR